MTTGEGAAHGSPNLAKYARRGLVSRVHQRRFFDLVARRVAAFAPSSVLDAGCGEGFVAEALAARLPGVSIRAVDVDPAAVAFAASRSRSSVSYGVASLDALPFADGAVDVVVCTEVLEHLAAPDRALAELRRVARVGVVVTVPREPVFRTLLAMGMATGVSPDPEHVNFWTPAQFARWLRLADPGARTATHSLYNVGVVAASEPPVRISRP